MDTKLNIGMHIEGDRPLHTDEVKAAIRKHYGGRFDWELRQSGTDPTMVVTLLHGPMLSDQVYAMAKELKQDCIAIRYENGDGALIGPRAEKWGFFNPEFFLE